MRQSKYLNVILTVNAALLTGLLWTHVVQQPLLDQTASAQTTPKTTMAGDNASGIPNAADQRQKILEAIRDLKTSVDATRKIVEGGKMRVEVTNLNEIKKVEVTNIEQLKPKP